MITARLNKIIEVSLLALMGCKHAKYLIGNPAMDKLLYEIPKNSKRIRDSVANVIVIETIGIKGYDDLWYSILNGNALRVAQIHKEPVKAIKYNYIYNCVVF
jgi:hypothetical protein